MTKDTNTPQPVGSLRALLVDYRCKVAELVQDRHSHGVTTEQLAAADAEAEAAITALIEGAAPAKDDRMFLGMNGPLPDSPVRETCYQQGYNEAIELYRANLLRALNGKEQNE